MLPQIQTDIPGFSLKQGPSVREVIFDFSLKLESHQIQALTSTHFEEDGTDYSNWASRYRTNK